MDAFAEILVDYNQKVNLTAITDPEGIEDKHFLDSLLFASQPEVAGRMVVIIHRATSRYGSSLTLRSLLRTHRRHGYLPFGARQLLHIVKIELCSPFYHRIPLLEESLVARIEIMLPEMGGEPRGKNTG